jgi:hypothetical protein
MAGACETANVQTTIVQDSPSRDAADEKDASPWCCADVLRWRAAMALRLRCQQCVVRSCDAPSHLVDVRCANPQIG